MAPRFLTCIPIDTARVPRGMIIVPPVFPQDEDMPVRLKDEAGTVVGLAMARTDASMADGAFQAFRQDAGDLGVEEGFDYSIEPLEPLPPPVRSAVLHHKGGKALAECCGRVVEDLKAALGGMEARIVQPGNIAFRLNDSDLEFTSKVHPSEKGPPWMLSSHAQIILEDPGGPADVVIAVDGPASMNRADLRDEPGGATYSRKETLCAGVSRFCHEMAFNAHPGRVAMFLLTEEATPLLFSERGAATPWLSCCIKGQQDVVSPASINEILTSRLDGDLPPVRNLAASLKGLIEYIHQHKAERPDSTVTVILISDGQYNEGPNPVSVLKEESQHGLCFVLHVIGLGEEVEEPYLKRLAREGHGTFEKINRADGFIDSMVEHCRNFRIVMKDSV